MTTNRLRELMSRATPGPWTARKEEYDNHEIMTAETGKAYGRGGHALHYLVADGGVFPAFTGNGPTSKDNAEYLAAVHDTLPAMLDVIDAAEESGHCPDHAGNCCKGWCDACQHFEKANDKFGAALIRFRMLSNVNGGER